MPDWKSETRDRLAELNIDPTRGDEIAEEMAQHLQDRYEELLSAGATAASAAETALAELNDSLLTKQLRMVETRGANQPIVLGGNRSSIIADIWQDLRYGFRLMRQSPVFTSVAVITLALGIGANSAIFSLVNGILLRPLPYQQPDRLVRLIQANKKLGLDTWGVSQADFAAYRDQSRSFETVAAYSNNGVNLTGGGEPERLLASNVTADFFKALGVNPVLGRTFHPGEDTEGKNNVCVLSYGLWLRRFGGDRHIIEKSLDLNNIATEVVGVAPANFEFPRAETEVWIPQAVNPTRTAPYLFRVIARLKPGVEPTQAEAETTSIIRNFGRQHPDTGEAAGLDGPVGAKTIVTPLKEVIVGKTEKPLLVLLSAVGLVLLIACANVTNLLLARATLRTKEMAVRFALGATPSRVARQLMTESLLLAAIGAGVGIGLARLGLTMLDRLPAVGIPRINEVALNGRVLAFTAALALLTGLLFGLMPAARVYRMGLAAGMRQGGRDGMPSRRLNSALVAVQFALSLILLIGASLLLKSFQRLESVGLGFDPSGTLTMAASLPRTKYIQPEQAARFYESLAERMRVLPEVRTASVTTNLPFGEDGYEDNFVVEGKELANNSRSEQAEFQSVTPGFFRTMSIPLLSGRDFEVTDSGRSPLVAIVDETIARRYFPEGGAIGKRIESTGDRQWMTIVGIVGPVKHNGLAEAEQPHIYFPITQPVVTPLRAYLVLRTDGAPAALAAAVRNEVSQLDSNVPVYSVRPMREVVGQTLNNQRLTNLLLTSFSILALLLSAVGIYGTMAVYVGNRTNEFGIRLALGAKPGRLLGYVLGEGIMLASIGVVVGVVGALILTRAIVSLLFEVSATDPVTFTSVPLLLLAVAALACYIPARRASRVDPIVVLRCE